MTNREKAADARFRRVYGKSLADYNAQFEAQGRGCAICDRPPKKLRLFQDHDHKCCPRRLKKYCGKCNRGLLCMICNRKVVGVIEKFKIPIDRLYEYLTNWHTVLVQRGAYAVKEPKAKTKKAKVRRKQKSIR